MKKTKIPKTDSIQELARFWDTHDLTDFEGELVEVAGTELFDVGFECAFILGQERREGFHMAYPQLLG